MIFLTQENFQSQRYLSWFLRGWNLTLQRYFTNTILLPSASLCREIKQWRKPLLFFTILHTWTAGRMLPEKFGCTGVQIYRCTVSRMDKLTLISHYLKLLPLVQHDIHSTEVLTGVGKLCSNSWQRSYRVLNFPRATCSILLTVKWTLSLKTRPSVVSSCNTTASRLYEGGQQIILYRLV